MKIMYVGSFKHIWDEECIAREFESLGHTVFRAEEGLASIGQFKAFVEANQPDLVLFAKFKNYDATERKEFLRYLSKKGIKTATWLWDLFFGLHRESLLRHDPVFRCDYVFSPDGGNHQKFLDMGINHHVLRQGIFTDYCERGNEDKDLKSDVVFVGSFNSQWLFREEVCDSLVKYDFKRYGKKDTQEIRGGRLNDLYASTKVVIGDSVYSPYYWSNRIYETLGRGGFLIHPMIEGLDKEYQPYEHFVPFKYGDTGSLHEKIDYFLAHPEERKRMSDAALEYTKSHHTIRHRCEELLSHIV